MVGWPPDDRPPLGKGPTGKDKPKSFDGSEMHPMDFFSSQDSESADSASTRTSSVSPSAITTSSRAMQVIDNEAWEHALTMPDHHDQPDVASSADSSYQLAPMTAPLLSKPLYSPYGHSLPSSLPSSRNSVPPSSSISNNANANMYMHPSASYSQSSERQLGGSYGSPSFVMRGGEMRDEPPRQHYSYSQSSYQNQDHNMHSQSPPPPPSTPSLPQGHSHLHQREPVPFVHRRALTEQHSIGQGFPHLPNPAQLQQSMRQQPEQQHRMYESDQHNYRVAYGSDGRINSMP